MLRPDEMRQTNKIEIKLSHWDYTTLRSMKCWEFPLY